ncbi:MAG: PAS domain-containing protein, partial [Leptospiraceae bacterium]|nr:PAS domain-containing protein [Leptospiraceae bacterium]
MAQAQASQVDQSAKENHRLRGAIAGSQTAIMMVDRDFNITYVNPATEKLIAKNIKDFQKAYPGVDFKKMIGQNIDIFHKNPARQRDLLADPGNLPYQTEIQIGSSHFRLNVTAIMDEDGHYEGNNLEWSDITRERDEANRAQALLSMVNNANSYYQMADLEGNITFMNKSLRNMMMKYLESFQKFFPGFNPDKLVGMNIHDFHKNPERQRRLLKNESQLPYKTEIKLGHLEFGLNATALYDAQGKMIGNAVEWTDLNARARYRDEVNRLTEALQEGQLSARGNVEAMDEVYGPILARINDVIEVILEPIDELRERLPEIAKGNLTAYVEGDYAGDHAAIKESLNKTLDELNRILQGITGAVDQINVGSGQVSDSSNALSQGASKQAAAIEEISASIEEISAQIQQTADNAGVANTLVTETR